MYDKKKETEDNVNIIKKKFNLNSLEDIYRSINIDSVTLSKRVRGALVRSKLEIDNLWDFSNINYFDLGLYGVNSGDLERIDNILSLYGIKNNMDLKYKKSIEIGERERRMIINALALSAVLEITDNKGKTKILYSKVKSFYARMSNLTLNEIRAPGTNSDGKYIIMPPDYVKAIIEILRNLKKPYPLCNYLTHSVSEYDKDIAKRYSHLEDSNIQLLIWGLEVYNKRFKNKDKTNIIDISSLIEQFDTNNKNIDPENNNLTCRNRIRDILDKYDFDNFSDLLMSIRLSDLRRGEKPLLNEWQFYNHSVYRLEFKKLFDITSNHIIVNLERSDSMILTWALSHIGMYWVIDNGIAHWYMDLNEPYITNFSNLIFSIYKAGKTVMITRKYKNEKMKRELKEKEEKRRKDYIEKKLHDLLNDLVNEKNIAVFDLPIKYLNISDKAKDLLKLKKLNKISSLICIYPNELLDILQDLDIFLEIAKSLVPFGITWKENKDDIPTKIIDEYKCYPYSGYWIPKINNKIMSSRLVQLELGNINPVEYFKYTNLDPYKFKMTEIDEAYCNRAIKDATNFHWSLNLSNDVSRTLYDCMYREQFGNS